MAASRNKSSSFTRTTTTSEALGRVPGLRHGLNGTTLISTGIADLDSILFFFFSFSPFISHKEEILELGFPLE